MHSNILEIINKNIKENKYIPLPPKESAIIRHYYRSQIPCHISLTGNKVVVASSEHTVIATGYDRIVTGDYGAYLEIKEKDIIKDSIIIKRGQEYRLEPKYKNNVKYLWYTAKDNSNIKIYYQQRTVAYADYKVGYYYIDPKEVCMYPLKGEQY